jgi:lycopene cyclase domain-containing protein
MRRQISRSHLACWGVLALIILIFTTPWDNFAVYLGIWGFGDGVSLGYPFKDWAQTYSWVGHIPFEEYSFFIIEATLVCLTSLFFLPKRAGRK